MDSFKKALAIVFFLSIVIYIFLSLYKFPLPPQSEIKTSLHFETTKQVDNSYAPFIKKVNGTTYRITPRFNYDISGLVVSEYDSQNWLDVTHKDDPMQSKDLCLIWGENLSNGVYRKLKYDHGEFTCYVGWDSRSQSDFRPNQLSNNHLMPSNDYLANKIKTILPGDQVIIKGWLIDYEILDESSQVKYFRDTSTVREDKGCEIIWVNNIEVISAYQPWIRQIKSSLPAVSIGSGILLFISIFFL